MGRGQSPKSVTLGIHSHGGSQDPPWSAAISFSQSRSRHRLLTPTCSLQPMREPLGQTAHKLWRLSPVSSRPTGTHLKFNKVRLIDSAMRKISRQKNHDVSLNKGKDGVILGQRSWVELCLDGLKGKLSLCTTISFRSALQVGPKPCFLRDVHHEMDVQCCIQGPFIRSSACGCQLRLLFYVNGTWTGEMYCLLFDRISNSEVSDGLWFWKTKYLSVYKKQQSLQEGDTRQLQYVLGRNIESC